MLGCELAACATHSKPQQGQSARGTSRSATSCPLGKIFSRDGHLFGRQKRDKWNSFCSQPLDFMAVPTGLEPVTFGLGNGRSGGGPELYNTSKKVGCHIPLTVRCYPR